MELRLEAMYFSRHGINNSLSQQYIHTIYCLLHICYIEKPGEADLKARLSFQASDKTSPGDIFYHPGIFRYFNVFNYISLYFT